MSETIVNGDPTLFKDMPPPIAEGKGRIRPRARLLRTIGAELISNEVVAVIELVRNCYDADSSEVIIAFSGMAGNQRASLEIRDNGHGMTRDVLLGPWLEPATDYKSAKGSGGGAGEHSPAGRRRLGSKGVGRFAAQRLGRHLEVRTRATGLSTELVARFDWSALEQDQYLDQVRIPWREDTAKHVLKQGTHLLIRDLRDHWTPERFDKLALGLSRLVSPTMRHKFRIFIDINGAREEVKPAIDASAAMYSVAGEVGENGHATITYNDINGTEEVWERSLLWPQDHRQACGPFSFRINSWDLDSEPLRHYLRKTKSPLGLRDFRRLIRDHSGISLYRDGFRILPYGEPDNDWLRLDRRRVNNPTLRMSNNQILGTIQLGADSNPHLNDQTNREGLVNNEAYGHLVEVMTELLSYLETRRFTARRSMDLNWQKKSSTLPDANDDAQAQKIEDLIQQIGDQETQSKEVAQQLGIEFEQYRDRSTDAIRHYAGLATSGQLSGLVFNQLRMPLRKMENELEVVVDDLLSLKLTDEDIEDARDSVQQALQAIQTMMKRMETLDPLAVGGRGRRTSECDVTQLVIQVVQLFQPTASKLGVVIHLAAMPDHILQTNQEIAQQVLSNLLDNAIYFASLSDTGNPTVMVRVLADGFSISNNGPPVQESDVATIWEPHFSRKEGAHGMGLTLVKDLLSTIGGRVTLESPETAQFRVVLGE